MAIGFIGDTAAQARAKCLALGLSAKDCDEHIAAQSVNGVFCDGDIVIDASGKRCVSAKVVDQKLALQQQALGTRFDPLPSAAASNVGAMKVAAALVAAALVVGGIYFVMDR